MRPRGENDAALDSGCVAAPATLGGDKRREAIEGAGALCPTQHGHGVMLVLRSGGVGAERAADGPPTDEPAWVRCGFAPIPRNPGGKLMFLWMGGQPKFLAGQLKKERQIKQRVSRGFEGIGWERGASPSGANARKANARITRGVSPCASLGGKTPLCDVAFSPATNRMPRTFARHQPLRSASA